VIRWSDGQIAQAIGADASDVDFRDGSALEA
jgi:hypothetical protein